VVKEVSLAAEGMLGTPHQAPGGWTAKASLAGRKITTSVTNSVVVCGPFFVEGSGELARGNIGSYIDRSQKGLDGW
jgi:hypothetical protein